MLAGMQQNAAISSMYEWRNESTSIHSVYINPDRNSMMPLVAKNLANPDAPYVCKNSDSV